MLPYLAFTVEEVSAACHLRSLSHWSNTKVRILGLVTKRNKETEVILLQSLGEELKTTIQVDIKY